MRALSLGVPAFSSRSAFALSLTARSRFAAWASRYSRTVCAARDSSAGARKGSAPRRPRTRAYRRPNLSFKRGGRRVLRRKRTLADPKGGRLLSLMIRILFRPVLFVVITLSLSLPAGCSGLFGGPSEQANDRLGEANEAIEEHNRLFEEARDTYEEAREAVESGESTSAEATSEETERFAEVRSTMQEARSELAEAREPLSEVQDLDVEPEIKEYAGLLLESVDARLAAEDGEIQYYEILEQDPTLTENREEALDLLAEAGESYQEADEAYGRAQRLAESNPELLKER